MTRRGRELRLSERLLALAEMVPEKKSVADVGCDHGFLDIYLVLNKNAPGAWAMDVRKGPLAAAAQHIREYGLEDRIKTVLSDGLENYEAGAAQILVCAGMGGPLMQRILTSYPEKTESFEEMILQPQSELREFREFLRKNDYRILEERILLDEGKYYFPMRVRKEAAFLEEGLPDQELCDRFGAYLLRERSPLLRQYLLQQQRVFDGIRERLQDQEKHSERVREVEEEREALRRALMLWE